MIGGILPANLGRDLARDLKATRALKTREIWTPTERQTLAVETMADETFFGGQAGGGKTDLLGFIPLYYPGSRCILYRRESGQHDDLIERMRLVLEPAGGAIVTSKKGGAQAIFPNGSTLRFAHIAHDKHIQTWRGRAHELLLWDEVSEIAERHFRALKGWQRKATTLSGHQTRLIAGGNPATQQEDGQIVGKWLIRYFAPWIQRGYRNAAKPGELRWFVRDRDPVTGTEFDREIPGPTEGPERPPPYEVDLGKGPELVLPHSRTYIPSKLADNPYLGDAYRKQLDAMPEPFRSALRDGDWYSALDLDDAWALVASESLRVSHERWETALRTGSDDENTWEFGFRVPHGATLASIGVDVSRGGADDTVLMLRFNTPAGDWLARPIRFPGQAIRTGGQVVQVLEKFYRSGVRIKIDAIGVGAAVVDAAVAMFGEFAVEPMNASAVSFNRTEGGAGVTAKFRNSRAEWFWRLRERTDPENGTGLMLPPDDRLDEELNTIRWEVSSAGIGIEPKERLHKRLGRSPDTADAVALACADSIEAGFVSLE